MLRLKNIVITLFLLFIVFNFIVFYFGIFDLSDIYLNKTDSTMNIMEIEKKLNSSSGLTLLERKNLNSELEELKRIKGIEEDTNLLLKETCKRYDAILEIEIKKKKNE